MSCVATASRAYATAAKERAVAGRSIEGTALDLNIRRTSVITYRQRAYLKLGISRHNELVALVHNVRSDGVAECGSADRCGGITAEHWQHQQS